MKQAIINGKFILQTGIAEGICLLIEEDKIIGISNEAPADFKIIDAENCYVSAGFVDMHVHGGGGHDFMDGTVEAIVSACQLHLKHGTTSICPTTTTCSDEELFKFLDCYKEAKKSSKIMPKLIGIHLEGPYLNQEMAGAQDPKYLLNPKKQHYQKLLNYSNDIIRISAAPELSGAYELGDELKKRDIITSIAHSDAEYSVVKEAVKHGYRHVTHLYSGMSMLHRKNAYRYLGVVESSYLLDELTVEIIADGKHLPYELLELIVKLKNNDLISLVTDGMRGAGMAEGAKMTIGSKNNGLPVIIKDEVAFLEDESCFAGSVCTSDRCIRTMKQIIGIDKAVKMMTINPCTVLRLESKGLLKEGYDADINIFDADINIKRVIVGGRTLVQRGELA